MKWLILLVGVVVVCAVVAMILGLAGGGLGRPTSSLSHEPLPDDAIADDDFDDLVFDVAVRGYRMSQVDGVVDRLRRELREKDEQIAVLRGGDGEPSDVGDASDTSDAGDAGEVSEPVEGTDAAEVSEPAGASEPSEASEPAGASEPSEASEPAGASEPVEPSEASSGAEAEPEADAATAKDSRTA